MLIDTHAHLNFPSFKDDTDQVIGRSLENDIWIVNVGSNLKSSERAIQLAEKYKQGVYAAIGLHPINLDTGLVKIKVDEKEGSHFEKEFDFARYKELARHEKVIAIGEIGLDYYWKPKTKGRLLLFKEKQKELFLKELELTRALNLPVILHCRMGHDDLINIFLDNSEFKPERAVAHSFVGNLTQLQKYLDFGFYIGYNGIIFKQIEGIDFEQIINNTPLERILIETDCPYLSPPQFKKERNEPISIKYIAEKIAEIKKIGFERLAEVTTKNAKELFQI